MPPIDGPSDLSVPTKSDSTKLFPDNNSVDDLPMPPPLVDQGNNSLDSLDDLPAVPESTPPVWTDDEPPADPIDSLIEGKTVDEEKIDSDSSVDNSSEVPEPVNETDSDVDLPSFEESENPIQGEVVEDPKEFLQARGMSLENLFVEREHYAKMLSLLEETVNSEKDFAKEDKRYTKLAQKQAQLLKKVSSGFLKINKNLVSIEEKLGRV